MNDRSPRWAEEFRRRLPTGWPQTTIGAIADLLSGTTPPRSNSERYYNGGTVPWVKTGDLTDSDVCSTDECITELAVRECRCAIRPPGTLLVAMYGGFRQIGRTGLLRLPAATNQAITAIRIKPSSGVSPEFLQAWLNFRKPAWRRIAGSSRKDPNILKADIAAFPVPVPTGTLAHILGEVLASFDDAGRSLAALLAVKRQFSRGLANQLLTGQKRFPEFKHTAWVYEKLGNLVESVTRRNAGGVSLVLSASGARGLVDQRRYFKKSVAGDDISRYYLMKHGEFAYNRSAMQGYPFGATKRLDAFEEGVLSTLYLCFSIRDARLDSDFLVHLFESGALERQLRRITRVGGRAHGLLNVTASDYFAITIPLPDQDEQRRIAQALSDCSREINLLIRLKQQLDIQKRGILAQLLSGEIALPA